LRGGRRSIVQGKPRRARDYLGENHEGTNTGGMQGKAQTKASRFIGEKKSKGSMGKAALPRRVGRFFM